mmetsp:Transcript_15666/g.26310  ORF Transcript_15666/g.26310 Transcript_15666/m.26310 type:complete len:112 (-) Transcript_15666:92-427(-)
MDCIKGSKQTSHHLVIGVQVDINRRFSLSINNSTGNKGEEKGVHLPDGHTKKKNVDLMLVLLGCHWFQGCNSQYPGVYACKKCEEKVILHHILVVFCSIIMMIIIMSMPKK